MPGTDIESLPLFMYEEIGSYCDNKTLTQLVSVSVNFYNWFNGSRLKNFCMFGHMHVVTYWLKGLLSERSQRLVPRLKAIEYFEIEFPLGNPKRNNLPRDQGYELADLLVRLLSEMIIVKSAVLDFDRMCPEVIELLITLLESKPNGMIKHSALDISALPELTSAYLGCCDPSKLTSVYLHTDWKVRSHDYNGFGLAHGDYTMEYDQLLRLYRDQVPKLKRLRLALGTDVRNSLKATFREIEVITTEFPELEWLIVHEFMGYRPDFMELESDLNWFVDILNSTKLTHLVIMIDNISAFEFFQRNHPAVSEDQALKDFEYWYQRLVCLLVESCPRLQQLFIIDDWDSFHNATRDNVGVSVRRLNCDEMSQITQSGSFPGGLSG